MDSSKLGSWLQILGNLGLVVGLILVAVQINQNTNIARAQLYSEGITSSMNLDLAMMGENPAAVWGKEQSNQEQLTDEELAVKLALVNYIWKDIIRTETLASMGLPTQSAKNAAISFVKGPYGIGDDFGHAWWEEMKAGLGAAAPATREAVNAMLEQAGTADHKANQLASIRERISELAKQRANAME